MKKRTTSGEADKSQAMSSNLSYGGLLLQRAASIIDSDEGENVFSFLETFINKVGKVVRRWRSLF